MTGARYAAFKLSFIGWLDEFPVVFTFFLGVGVYRLALKKALVRRAVSVENIGRVSVICSDKTGTITEGYFQLTHFFPASGFDNHQLLVIAGIASRSESGDLLDLAIFTDIKKQNIILPERIATFPFTENRKRETSITLTDLGKWQVATKGAPETILALTTLSSDEQTLWLQSITELASSGCKVIAAAVATIEPAGEPVEPTSHYQLAGLLAFADPPRKQVREAVQLCQEGLIKVLMITGDHPETARAIACQIGLGEGHPKVLLGHDIAAYLQEHGKESLQNIDVIARAIPSHKLDIVTALQSLDEIVAVTGDGVNDVPALKAGDIGIAMGERGTQSAREVADIILLDDNFTSIVQAISEGRQLFKNLQLSFKYLLMIHMPFIFSAAIIPLLGLPLIYFPIHIVLIELIIHPTSMLVFQDLPKGEHLDAIKSKRKQISFFNSSEWIFMLVMGLFTTIVVILSYIFYVKTSVDHARGLVLTELCFMSAAITIGLSGLQTRISRIMTLATVAFGIVLIQSPIIAHLMSYAPLQLSDWLIVTLASLVTLWLARMAK